MRAVLSELRVCRMLINLFCAHVVLCCALRLGAKGSFPWLTLHAGRPFKALHRLREGGVLRHVHVQQHARVAHLRQDKYGSNKVETSMRTAHEQMRRHDGKDSVVGSRAVSRHSVDPKS